MSTKIADPTAATMVMMGINRIVVTDGKIQAKVMFDFQARDNRRYQASATQFDHARDAAGVGLRMDPAALSSIEDFFRRRNRSMNPSIRKQAMLPDGAEVLFNPVAGVFSVGFGLGVTCLVGECNDYTWNDAAVDFGDDGVAHVLSLTCGIRRTASARSAR